VTFSPTTEPIEPPMKAKSMTQIATRAADRARAPDRRVADAGRDLCRGEPVRIGLLVDEPSAIDRLEPGVALLEAVAVEEQRQAGIDAQPQVVAAARADALALRSSCLL
jgi:hypothetical protein